MTGVSLPCERNTHANVITDVCLHCGEAFALVDEAVLVARAGGEWIGYICARPSCLDDHGRTRFADACQRFKGETEE